MTRAGLRRIDVRLEKILSAGDTLARTAATPWDELAGDEDLQDATRHRLQVAVQAAIDAGNQIISAAGWTTPEGYGGVFTELSVRGVLDPRLASRLRQAVGLRNLLVHDYLNIDDEIGDDRRLHASLPEDVADLRAYCAAVYAWLAVDQT